MLCSPAKAEQGRDRRLVLLLQTNSLAAGCKGYLDRPAIGPVFGRFNNSVIERGASFNKFFEGFAFNRLQGQRRNIAGSRNDKLSTFEVYVRLRAIIGKKIP